MDNTQRSPFDFDGSTANKKNTFDGNPSFEDMLNRISAENRLLDNKIGVNNNYLNGLFASPMLADTNNLGLNRTDRRTGFLKSLFTVPI